MTIKKMENENLKHSADAQGSVEIKKSDRALAEEKILEFWRENNTFQKSLEKDAPNGPASALGSGEAQNYVFYDGPPFATGQMHYGHILGSTAKDVVGRYQSMRGFRVPRKWGWDCHGLPIENIVEKELGIAGHKEIEKMGLEKFVEHARSTVLKYDKDWEKGVERIGRWVDFKGGYKTMDNTFIESVWHALSKVNEKGLLYEGVRVLPYCARCETPIANSEIAMDNSYKDISDLSVYVKFELVDEPGTFLLAWTTTPWTLPGNTAIAVGSDITYSIYHVTHEDGKEEKVIIAKDLAEKVLAGKKFEVVKEVKGGDLVGKSYKPIFSYYKDVEMPNKENIWKVWHADFVTTEKGTGIAHQAPAFGEEDFELAKKNGVPTIIHVDTSGKFVGAVSDMAGFSVKPKDTEEDKDAHMRTDIEVIRRLQENGAFFAKEKILHSYPHCMRCDTPIIYYALPSWFVNIQKIKPELMKTAETVTWIPEHLKEGRFKNILENAPDWTISRNRFWASPLPIWKSAEGKIMMVNSIEDLKQKTKNSGNKYFVMRHGGTEGNEKGVVSYKNQGEDNLTTLGIEQVKGSVKDLKEKNIDLIISSTFTRTKETTEILKNELGLSDDQVVFSEDLIEINPGEYDGKSWDDYHEFIYNMESPDWFCHKMPGGESLKDVHTRMGKALYDLEKKYENKNILIVTHGGPAWLLFVHSGEYLPGDHAHHSKDENLFVKNFKKFDNAEVRELPFVPIPHNANFEMDLHRPYIDEIILVDDENVEYKRIPEVLDCWFESGSMPFAQDHYPFDRPNWKEENFPAGFVAEYIAQTRTWFYYMLVISTILFGHAPFKNVITTGTLRASDGQKISKSKKNYPDPWIFIDQYGMDALRMYLMASPLMKGEDANFDEKAVASFKSKVVDRLLNVVAFYDLYRDKSLETSVQSGEVSLSVLDQWIVARLHETYEKVTVSMEKYELAEAVRPFESFIDDLSTWYLRRSRERLKDGDKDAKSTLYIVLKQTIVLLAPFAPFVSEEIWQKLKIESDEESVHLALWPKGPILGEELLEQSVIQKMEETRRFVTLGLEARQKAGIKVRQPLHEFKVKSCNIENEYIDIIKDELNVKEFLVDEEIIDDVLLDTIITQELKLEGEYRDIMRAVQDLRKETGLTPSDVINVTISESAKIILEPFMEAFKKTVGASGVTFAENDGVEVKIGEMVLKIKISK
jgi:isoleucyl-tRNA synthetase